MLHRTDLLTIGELSARSGFAPSALRYYENLGLITSGRTSGNQRRYERAMLRRLAFIRSAQRVGLSLDEITQALPGLGGQGLAVLPAHGLVIAQVVEIGREARLDLGHFVQVVRGVVAGLGRGVGGGATVH